MSEQSKSYTVRTTPVSWADRIAALDMLRGFELLGILLLNIQDFAPPASTLHDIPLDVVIQAGPTDFTPG